MGCNKCFLDWIACGVETIEVSSALAPDSIYIWVISNKGSKYTGSITTDWEGKFSINVSDFPVGFFNPYAGSFVLEIKDNNSNYCESVLVNDGCQDFICIEFEVVNGNSNKNSIGCPCTLTEIFDDSFDLSFN
jgi:hypothetical protein